MKKKQYIEALRALAVIAVISIHVTVPYYGKFYEISSFGWWVANIFNAGARFSVPLFIMISGAVLLGRVSTVTEFYSKRVLRILPPILFWYSFYLIFSYITSDSHNFKSQLYSLIIEGKPYYHLWYLTMFSFLMIAAPFINMLLIGEKPTQNEVKILLTVFFLFFTMNAFLKNYGIAWYKTFPWYIGYFIGGFFIEKYGTQYKRYNYSLIIIISSLTALGALLNYFSISRFDIIKDNFILGSTSPLVFLITFSIYLYAKNNISFEHRLIQRVSDASFGMYLIHPVILYFIRHFLFHFNIKPYLSIPITLMVTSLTAFITIEFIRRYRFFRYIC